MASPIVLKKSSWISLLALIFFFEQNIYFGWNAVPHSDAELIADGIGMLLFALSFLARVE